MSTYHTTEQLLEEATIKPLCETYQRIPEETETQIAAIIRREIEPLIARMEALEAKMLDLAADKQVRDDLAKQAAERAAAASLRFEEEMKIRQEEYIATRGYSTCDCTPRHGRSSFLLGSLGRRT